MDSRQLFSLLRHRFNSAQTQTLVLLEKSLAFAALKNRKSLLYVPILRKPIGLYFEKLKKTTCFYGACHKDPYTIHAWLCGLHKSREFWWIFLKINEIEREFGHHVLHTSLLNVKTPQRCTL